MISLLLYFYSLYVFYTTKPFSFSLGLGIGSILRFFFKGPIMLKSTISNYIEVPTQAHNHHYIL